VNAIKAMRTQVGLTQHALAARAGTAQSTIAAYESGRKSPTLRTLEKTARAVGLEMHVTFTPLMTREDRRSLAFHRAIADRLREEPERVLDCARRQLRLLARSHPHAARMLRRWRCWLGLPVAELISRMLDPGLDARDMRQVSPFAGVLTAQERALVLRNFRRESA
jgi:transcriptional regulator with XRE-family HTH domain